MNREFVAQLCRAYSLGSPLSSPLIVEGGLLHRMWRVETDSGAYAVKQLNPEIMQRPGVRAIYRLSEEVARAFSSVGIPALPALQSGNSPLFEMGEVAALVFPWVEACTLPEEDISPSKAVQIGRILGEIHRRQPDVNGLQTPQYDQFPDERWNVLIQQASLRQAPWAQMAHGFASDLARWSSNYGESVETLKGTSVISHRDLDQKNVLWEDDHSPILIDWEAAGLVNPTMEIVEVALNWSGLATGEIDRKVFRRTLEAYQDSGNLHVGSLNAAVGGCMGNWLAWLGYNMHRSIPENAMDEHERQVATEEVPKTLSILHTLDAFSIQSL